MKSTAGRVSKRHRAGWSSTCSATATMARRRFRNSMGIPRTVSAITTGMLVRQMVDLDCLTEFPQQPHKTVQFSSYDRNSTAPYAPGWFANADGYGGSPLVNFAQTLTPPDANGIGNYLIADIVGPGAIVRTWAAANAFKGQVTVYLDNNSEPLYQGQGLEFFTNKYSCLLLSGSSFPNRSLMASFSSMSLDLFVFEVMASIVKNPSLRLIIEVFR